MPDPGPVRSGGLPHPAAGEPSDPRAGHFGPEPPAGKESNWIQTIPGKGYFVALRLYGPLQPWFDKTWRPGEIELVD